MACRFATPCWYDGQAMTRQPRALRRPRTQITLMPRDHELLRAIARLRLARTSSLVQLCFQGIRRDTAARRLRRLFDGGFLDVRSPSLASESLYSLGTVGRQWLQSQSEAAGAAIPRGGIEHHLAIVETWVALATMQLPTAMLQAARADWELRAELVGTHSPIVPDLFALLDRPWGVDALAVEVDLATEPLKVLRAKLEVYRRLHDSPEGLFGSPRFILAIATTGRGRLASIRDLMVAEWRGAGCAWLLGEGPVEALGRLVGHGAGALTASPHSKGMSNDATACAAGRGGGLA